jgi:hypothetical protein
VAATAAVTACTRAPQDDPAPATATAQHALADEAALARALAARANDELVLDARPDGTVLLARLDPAPPRADPVRTLRVRRLDGGRTVAWGGDGLPLQDARLLPGDGALLLGIDGRLWSVATSNGAPRPLDRDVAAPLSMTPDGRWAAYVRGALPDYEVVRLELATGRTESVAPGRVAAWCPALSPDGRAVTFAAAATGYPELYRVAEDQAAPRRLTSRRGADDPSPIPTGPTAPAWLGELLLFEDDAGLRLVDGNGALRRSLPGWHAPVVLMDGRVLAHATREGGELRAWSAAELRGDP